MPPLTLHFPDTPTAEKALHLAGFSIGNQQHGSPRGIMFGTHKIGKWKRLTDEFRRGLHGEMREPDWFGHVSVRLHDHAPACAREALMKEME